VVNEVGFIYMLFSQLGIVSIGLFYYFTVITNNQVGGTFSHSRTPLPLTL